MRLNLDCIRDIMLWVEKTTTPTKFAVYKDTYMLKATHEALYDTPFNPDAVKQELNEKYDNETIMYHLNYCIEAGLLKSTDNSRSITITIQDLTPLGHEFTAKIRKDSNYQTFKNLAINAGVETFKSILTIANNVAASSITKTFID